MKISIFSLVAVPVLTLALATHAQAISVIWDSPTTIANDVTQVRTDGTLFGAWAFGQGTLGTTSVTVNNVTFSKFLDANAGATSGSNGNLSWSRYRMANLSSANAPYANLSTEYKSLLNSHMWMQTQGTGGGSANSVTFTLSGLTPGQTYLFQAWSEYPGALGFTANYSILGTTGSATISDNLTATNGGIGQFITAQITMGAETSFQFRLTGGPTGGDYAVINAMQLRAVPEPGTIALAGLGLGAILFFRRRSHAAR